MPEERKLIKLGMSSFAVSLPKGWIEKSNLKKGDKVSIIPNSNGEMIISPKFKKNPKANIKHVNIEKPIDEIKKDLIGFYINGCMSFNFIGKINNAEKKNLKKFMDSLIGFEIAEENPDRMIFKDFFNFENIGINNFTKRVQNNINEMFDIITASIEKAKLTKTEIIDIKEIDADINKIYFLVSRIMNLGLNNPALICHLNVDQLSLFNYWWLVFNLEHIGDGIKNMTKRLENQKLKKESSVKVVSLLMRLKDNLNNTLNAFYEKDKNLVYKIMEENYKISKECEKLTHNTDPILSLCAEKIKNIENTNYQIIKIILNFEE